MATKKKLLQAAAGTAAAGGGAGLNVEEVFSTYLYEGQENRVVKSEITSSESRTDNHIAYSFTLANNLGSSYTNTTDSNLSTDADLSLLNRSASSTVDNTTDRKLEMGLYSSSSEGKYFQSLYKNTSTVDSFSVAGTFPYGTATGVSVVEVRNGFNFSSSTAVQAGDLLLFVAVGKNSSYATASGFTEIEAVTETGGTYGFMARIAAKVADGTENGTDFGDNFLLTTSGSEYGILLRKTGGSWDISGAASAAASNSTNDVTATLITNDIDLTGEGGMVWIKNRETTDWHALFDTERGVGIQLASNDTRANYTLSNALTSFNSTGFSLGNDNSAVNSNAEDYASWTFRKAPKFFDVVTYTGTGSAQTIAHNLGTTVGTLIVKRTDSTGDWLVQHRSLGGTYYMDLQNQNAAATNTTYWNNTTATSTEFTVGTSSYTNASGGTYVAYLFAHNDGDGEFGSEADQDIIKCGSYTTDASADATINLGWEPQWVLFRPYDDTSNWKIVDNMRGFLATATASTGYNRELNPNTSGAELNNDGIQITSTGFDHVSGFASKNFIYIAIRRGPMAVPESATDVFAIDTRAAASGGTPAFTSGFPVDFSFTRRKSGTASWELSSRLIQGKRLYTNLTNAEASDAETQFDYMDGWNAATGANSDILAWMWRRAPNYFDVVAYTGNGTRGHAINHNLAAVPEMIWCKNRDQPDRWICYHSAIGNDKKLTLDDSSAASASDFAWWAKTDPTDQVFYLGESGKHNASGENHIAYLFASVDGVSKVGSINHISGTDTNVDCGFSNGARFVLWKQTDAANSWGVVDVERGLVSGNDALLLLNTTNAETSSYDLIDPLSSGFVFTGTFGTGSYIFYAIA